MKRYNPDGSFVDSIRLDTVYGVDEVDYDSNDNILLTKSGTNTSHTTRFDENGVFSKDIYHGARHMNVDSNDSLFISAVKRHYGPYADNYYGDPIPSDKAVAVIEKRSANGYYIWSRVLSPGDTQSLGMSARMNDAVYVPHSDSHSVIQGAGTVTITSLYLDVLNQYDGTLIGTKTWESDVANDEIRVKAITANEVTHSIYMISEVNNNGKYPGTNQYDGNIVIMKSIEYDTATDSRSGVHRNDTLKIVNDYDNNLQWIDDEYIDWNQWIYATEECSIISVDNGTTWRYPTLAELETTIDGSEEPAFNPAFVFKNNDYAYFTSDEVDTDGIRGVYYSDGGGSDTFSKSEDRLYTRCVRDMER